MDNKRNITKNKNGKMTSSSKKAKNKGKIVKKIFVGLIIAIVIIVGIVAGYVSNKLKKINYMDIDEQSLAVSYNVNSKYRNIALLAVDSRDVKTNDGSRSDGIIILNINQETKEVKLISVYRDTYVEVEGYGLTKITHAYAYGGPTLAINTLNRNLDLNISEFVTVNFEVVANIIDLIGGIEVNVKQEELSEMNKYILNTSKYTGISSPQLTHAGKQNLNGVQAVTYGRIRKTAGGDYRRTERMREVIMKAFNKTKKMNVTTLNKIIDTVLPNVQTNINSKEILSIVSQLISYEITDNIGWPYETKGKTLDAWYGVPVTLESNVIKLHQEVLENPEYEVPESVKTINQKIINKTGYKN